MSSNLVSKGRCLWTGGGIRHFIVDELRTALSKATVIAAPTEIRQLREHKSEGELELLKCANEATLLAIRHTPKHMHIGIRESDALADVGLNNGGCLTLFGMPPFPTEATPTAASTPTTLPCLIVPPPCTATGATSPAHLPSQPPPSPTPITLSTRPSISRFRPPMHAGVPVVAKRVDEAPRLFLGLAGYVKYFTHCLGHGIGLEVHEDPYLNGGRTSSSRQGILSNEPGVYIEGKVGVRLEDCFYIAQDGGAVYPTAGVGGPASSPWKP
ncbi:uncharacterized protein ARMOST_08010 [Armillaria ostoyae]|uniref:Peptidase M24 domain-containing protein n=1 Tax=Armillaria ostoyae TaxID=47428 RepID=A0A284R7G3_ARMOS|nr:uncharacterized protein ARMOST_08010 [Armillaria ostoyae]